MVTSSHNLHFRTNPIQITSEAPTVNLHYIPGVNLGPNFTVVVTVVVSMIVVIVVVTVIIFLDISCNNPVYLFKFIPDNLL